MARALRLTVVGADRVIEVGQEINGRPVARIDNLSTEYEDRIHCEFHAVDADGSLIVSVENAPLIIDWEKE